MARPANCAAPTLLLSGAARKLQTHLASYPPNYDDVFIEAHARIVNQGGATKTDLAVLGFWKHIRQAPWMEALLKADSDAVFKATTHALANDNTMTDSDRLRVLKDVPGFRATGPAVVSVLFACWKPERYAVYDARVRDDAKPLVVTKRCRCDWAVLITYWEHMSAIATEMSDDRETWTPRMIDQAMYEIGRKVAEQRRKQTASRGV